MGVIKDRHNTYYALKTVPAKPKGLRAAVALELKNGKTSQANPPTRLNILIDRDQQHHLTFDQQPY